jgi:hypothetical protein
LYHLKKRSGLWDCVKFLCYKLYDSVIF